MTYLLMMGCLPAYIGDKEPFIETNEVIIDFMEVVIDCNERVIDFMEVVIDFNVIRTEVMGWLAAGFY